MKKFMLICFLLSVFIPATILFSQDNKIGTNDFKLGMNKQAVTSAVKMKYDTKSLKSNSDGTQELFLERIRAKMWYDHNDALYKISVEIASDADGAKIKKKLLTEEYGEPVVIAEDFNDVTKLFLYSKWILAGGKYDIRLYESTYCRAKSPNPCVIVTTYLDTVLEKEYNSELEKRKRDEKLQKEKEKYSF